MTWTETRSDNSLVEPMISEELAKRYDRAEKDGKTYFCRKSGELFHLVRVRLEKDDADFLVIEYMDSMEDGDSFYPEDYNSPEALMEAIFQEIDQE